MCCGLVIDLLWEYLRVWPDSPTNRRDCYVYKWGRRIAPFYMQKRLWFQHRRGFYAATLVARSEQLQHDVVTFSIKFVHEAYAAKKGALQVTRTGDEIGPLALVTRTGVEIGKLGSRFLTDNFSLEGGFDHLRTQNIYYEGSYVLQPLLALVFNCRKN